LAQPLFHPRGKTPSHSRGRLTQKCRNLLPGFKNIHPFSIRQSSVPLPPPRAKMSPSPPAIHFSRLFTWHQGRLRVPFDPRRRDPLNLCCKCLWRGDFLFSNRPAEVTSFPSLKGKILPPLFFLLLFFCYSMTKLFSSRLWLQAAILLVRFPFFFPTTGDFLPPTKTPPFFVLVPGFDPGLRPVFLFAGCLFSPPGLKACSRVGFCRAGFPPGLFSAFFAERLALPLVEMFCQHPSFFPPLFLDVPLLSVFLFKRWPWYASGVLPNPCPL